MNKNQTTLAQAFAVSELPGLWGKRLDVPPGQQGVTLDKNGAVKVYQPGRHRVLSGRKRLFGGGAGFRAGIIPAGSFNARIKAENLLSGDDVLVDASLLCEVEVMGPGKFFTQWVLPRESLQGGSLDLSSKAAWEALGALTRQYTAADLVRGDPTERLLPKLRAGLEASLNGQGIYLDFVNFLSFWRADDRALAAEKALELEDRLRDVELEEKMAQVESKVQFQDFVNQLEPELVDKVGFHPVVKETPEDETEKGLKVLDTFKTWINFESKKDRDGRHFRIDGLFKRFGKKKEDQPRRRRRPERWWLPRAAWMVTVLLIAFLLTKGVGWVAGDAGWGARWEFYLTVWAFAIVAILESVKSLIKKREELEHTHWAEPGSTFVDDLVGKDRVQADGLVRKQCQQDLGTAERMLNDLRSRVYKSGDEDAALKIRNLEKKISRTRDEVMDPKLGVPPYVTDLNISRRLWFDLLDYDEELLIRVSALLADIQAFQDDYAQGEVSLEHLDQLESRLDAFRYHFENRSQALRASKKDKEHYRL